MTTDVNAVTDLTTESAELLTMWQQFKVNVEGVELDMLKLCKGTAAAGVRVRKALREQRAVMSKMVALSIKFEKDCRLTNKARKTPKVST